jgi:hypothetical protein
MQIGWRSDSLSYTKIERLHAQLYSIWFPVRFSIRFTVALLGAVDTYDSTSGYYFLTFGASPKNKYVARFCVSCWYCIWCRMGNQTENPRIYLHENQTDILMQKRTCRRTLSYGQIIFLTDLFAITLRFSCSFPSLCASTDTEPTAR